jgi:pimeloyl-ACP methyl ester carboxylesterase
MSERTSLTGSAWTQIGTGPATVQLISTGTTVMLVCASSAPTGNDGLILINQGDSHTFQLSLLVRPGSEAGAISFAGPR